MGAPRVVPLRKAGPVLLHGKGAGLLRERRWPHPHGIIVGSHVPRTPHRSIQVDFAAFSRPPRHRRCWACRAGVRTGVFARVSSLPPVSSRRRCAGVEGRCVFVAAAVTCHCRPHSPARCPSLARSPPSILEHAVSAGNKTQKADAELLGIASPMQARSCHQQA